MHVRGRVSAGLGNAPPCPGRVLPWVFRRNLNDDGCSCVVGFRALSLRAYLGGMGVVALATGGVVWWPGNLTTPASAWTFLGTSTA